MANILILTFHLPTNMYSKYIRLGVVSELHQEPIDQINLKTKRRK